MCKHGNVFSLAVLIGRGLDHNPSWFKIALSSPIDFLLLPLFSFQGIYLQDTQMCILFFVILKTIALLKCGFVQSIIIKKLGLRGKYVDNW